MSLKVQATCLIGALLLANVAFFVVLAGVGKLYPGLTFPGILAYTFGLRHAVDADHIAAIDNVTRKLIRDGQRPLTVGLWFSLGHSSVVVILCLLVLSGSTFLKNHLKDAEDIGAIVGTVFSAAVLFLIGTINTLTAFDLIETWKRVQQTQRDGSLRVPFKRERSAPMDVEYSRWQGQDHHHHFPKLTNLPKWMKKKLGSRRDCGIPPISRPISPFLPAGESYDDYRDDSIPTSQVPYHNHQPGRFSKLHSFFHGHSHGAGGRHHGKNGHNGYVHDGGMDSDGDEHDGHTHLVEVNADAEVEGPGFLVKCCPQLFNVVDAAWKMYPIGFLFGLGFDTATEVGLLALAALAPKEHIPACCVILLPLMFSIGMALVDTADGILMLWAYGWAEISPLKKIFFNLYLTVASAFIAIVIGAVEALGCMQQEMSLRGPFWDEIGYINDNFQLVGAGMVGFFVISSVAMILGFKCCFND